MTEVIRGGLSVPMSEAYVTDSSPVRISDLFVAVWDRAMQRAKLPTEERVAFDLEHYGYHESGRADVTARLVECRTEDHSCSECHGSVSAVYDHPWDEPIHLPFGYR